MTNLRALTSGGGGWPSWALPSGLAHRPASTSDTSSMARKADGMAVELARGLDRIAQHADAVDLHLADVAVLEGGWAARSAGHDHVARLQRHHIADELDQVGHVKQQVAGRGVLIHLAIDD